MEETQMDDISVFNFAIDEVSSILRVIMAPADATQEEYACLDLHQANLFILKQVFSLVHTDDF